MTNSTRRRGATARFRTTAVLAGLAWALGSLVASAAAAQDRIHQITWAHPSPASVAHFVVWLSPTSGDLGDARQVDVGLPAAESMGSLSVFSAMISFEEDEFIAVAAVGHDGQMSTPSDWTGMPPTRPGQPMPVLP